MTPFLDKTWKFNIISFQCVPEGPSGQVSIALQWHHNGHDSVSNHQPQQCLFNRLFGRRSKKTSKIRVTGLCVGNSPGTGEFRAQMASNTINVSIWWRHHGFRCWLGAAKHQAITWTNDHQHLGHYMPVLHHVSGWLYRLILSMFQIYILGKLFFVSISTMQSVYDHDVCK